MRSNCTVRVVLMLGFLTLLARPGTAFSNLDRVPARSSAPPELTVILIPGTTGSQLRHRETEHIVWGDGKSLLRPRDGGHNLLLPLDTDRMRDTQLEATQVIEEIHLAGVIKEPIYGPLLEHLEELGFERGDLRHPKPTDRLFAFAYDWRRDILVAVRQLEVALERIRRARPSSTSLRVALICQSNGALICRYLARYGGAGMAAAEEGRAAAPDSIEITDLFLVGAANGGSLRILREMHRGRRYLRGLGRRMRPEVVFSFRSLYPELPLESRDLVLDERGRSLAIDLSDARQWLRFDWSVFDPRVEATLESEGPASLGDAKSRFAYLQQYLDRARRFRALLADCADSPDHEANQRMPVLHLVGVRDLQTPIRALVKPSSKGGWKTFFGDDKEVERSAYWQEKLSAKGDGHASQASLEGLASCESDALAGPTVWAEGRHFSLILDPAWWAYLDRVLSERR